MVRRHSGRAKDGYFALIAVGRKDLEGVAELLQRRIQQFDVAAVGLVADEFVGRFLQLLYQLLGSDRLSLRLVLSFVLVDLLKGVVSFSAYLAFHPTSLMSFVICHWLCTRRMSQPRHTSGTDDK